MGAIIAQVLYKTVQSYEKNRDAQTFFITFFCYFPILL